MVTYNNIDLFKFIFAFFVIAIHTHPLEQCQILTLNRIYDIAISLAVPFYFITSGFLLGNKLNFIDNPTENADIVKKSLLKFLKLYCLWMMLYMPLAIWHDIINHTPFTKALILYVRGFIFAGEQYNSYVLWYLLSTIYALLLFRFLFQRGGELRHLLFISGAAVVLYIFMQMIKNDVIVPPPGIYQIVKKFLSFVFTNGRIFSGLIYLPIGFLLSKKSISLKYSIVLFIFGIIGCYNSPQYFNIFFLIFASIGLFGIIHSIHLKDNKIFPVFRYLSQKIYLLHLYVWTIWYFVVYRIKTFGIKAFVYTSFFTMLVACGCYYLKNVYVNTQKMDRFIG